MSAAGQKTRDFINSRLLPRIISWFPVWVTPNMITGFRLVLILPIVIAILLHLWSIFLVLYLLSLFSDCLDGALSRKRNLHSKFGAAFDPVVDKTLHSILFFFLLPFAPVLIGAIILADVIVLVGGGITISHFKKTKRELPIKGANYFGKMKVLCQGAVIFLLYGFEIFPKLLFLWPFALTLIIFTLFFSALSIIRYAFDLMRIKYN